MSSFTRRRFCKSTALAISSLGTMRTAAGASGQFREAASPQDLLDKNAQLHRFHFWQNQDWAWYRQNIPFFESPEPQIDETYYYRWEVITRHLRYASPEYGYVCTEFLIDRSNTWAGRYQAISGAADLHLDDLRWMKTQAPALDYLRYFLTVPGAKPRAYGLRSDLGGRWAGASARRRVFLERSFAECVQNYRDWEKGRVAYPNDNGFDPAMGLFWNTGRDMGSEFNLASATAERGASRDCWIQDPWRRGIPP